MGRLKRLALWGCAVHTSKAPRAPCVMSVLVVLMLSTACSTTEDITVVASDDTPAPTDSTAASDTPTPTDSTAAPGGETGTTPDDMSETPLAVSVQDSAGGQESVEVAPFTYEYPESWLINRNDRSTPLGKLCWAFFEYVSNMWALIYGIVAEHPNFEVTFPAIADLNEESNEPSIGTEDYFIDSLNEILEPSIAGVVDDIGLSEELQLFAKALFAYIEAEEEQTRAVGWANIDRTRLPYQDFEDLPHVKELNEAVIANPDKCASPSEDEMNEMNRFLDEQAAELEEYFERNRRPVTIE